MGIITLSTKFIPNETAIDTFSSPVEQRVALENITQQIIKNPGPKFARGDANTGTWGTLKDWNYTNNILNQNGNSAGGWKRDQDGIIHFESQNWDGAGFTNGKLYQTITLSPGQYSLEYKSDGFGGEATSMFAVALGQTLPNIEEASASGLLAYEISKDAAVKGTHKLIFQLNQTEEVSIGWTVTIPGSYTWYQISEVKLMILGLSN